MPPHSRIPQPGRSNRETFQTQPSAYRNVLDQMTQARGLRERNDRGMAEAQYKQDYQKAIESGVPMQSLHPPTPGMDLKAANDQLSYVTGGRGAAAPGTLVNGAGRGATPTAVTGAPLDAVTRANPAQGTLRNAPSNLNSPVIQSALDRVAEPKAPTGAITPTARGGNALTSIYGNGTSRPAMPGERAPSAAETAAGTTATGITHNTWDQQLAAKYPTLADPTHEDNKAFVSAYQDAVKKGTPFDPVALGHSVMAQQKQNAAGIADENAIVPTDNRGRTDAQLAAENAAKQTGFTPGSLADTAARASRAITNAPTTLATAAMNTVQGTAAKALTGVGLPDSAANLIATGVRGRVADTLNNAQDSLAIVKPRTSPPVAGLNAVQPGQGAATAAAMGLGRTPQTADRQSPLPAGFANNFQPATNPGVDTSYTTAGAAIPRRFTVAPDAPAAAPIATTQPVAQNNPLPPRADQDVENHAKGYVPSYAKGGPLDMATTHHGMHKAIKREKKAIALGTGGAKKGDIPVPINMPNGAPAVVNSGEVMDPTPAGPAILNRKQQKAMPTMAKGGVMIRPSHVGLLHKDLHVPMGTKIPAAKIATAKNSPNPAVRKRATFAANAKQWALK